MADTFDIALALTLGQEGAMSKEHGDPGGETFHGITQATLNYARERVAGLPLSVTDLTHQEITLIYKSLYFDGTKCGQLPTWMAIALFDAAVNSGPETAIRWLQEAVGVVVDGMIGIQTIAAVSSIKPLKVLREFHARRVFNFMEQTDEVPLFGLGWARRVILIHDEAVNFIPAEDPR